MEAHLFFSRNFLTYAPSTPPPTPTPFEVSKETFERLTTKIEKLENRVDGLEIVLADVTRFLEEQFPVEVVPPVVAEAHAVAAEALAVVPPIAAVAHAEAVARVYDTFLNANKKQHDLPLLPTDSMTKLKGATVRDGWDGSEYINATQFPHFVCRVTHRARLLTHNAEFPPPKSLAYNGAHLCCFTCRKVLTNFWTSKKGTKWVSCYKKNNDDMLEGCVNILSEANYDFVMSHIDEITTESVA